MRALCISLRSRTGHGLAIVDEHWTYGIRSAAAATLACKWLGPAQARVLGLVGIGSMGTNALRCLVRLFKLREIRCTSLRPETRAAFAKHWSVELGIRVAPATAPRRWCAAPTSWSVALLLLRS